MTKYDMNHDTKLPILSDTLKYERVLLTQFEMRMGATIAEFYSGQVPFSVFALRSQKCAAHIKFKENKVTIDHICISQEVMQKLIRMNFTIYEGIMYTERALQKKLMIYTLIFMQELIMYSDFGALIATISAISFGDIEDRVYASAQEIISQHMTEVYINVFDRLLLRDECNILYKMTKSEFYSFCDRLQVILRNNLKISILKSKENENHV